MKRAVIIWLRVFAPIFPIKERERERERLKVYVCVCTHRFFKKGEKKIVGATIIYY